MAKRSKSETERFYRRLVAEQERSGLTARAFAEARGIPPGTLSFWRYELKRRDQARTEAARPLPASSAGSPQRGRARRRRGPGGRPVRYPSAGPVPGPE